MIHLERLNKPSILVQKEQLWKDDFINSPDKKRPDSSKYAHNEIVKQLHSISFQKCFYCERKLKGIPKEVDHYIEVSDPNGRELAFEWDNLFLACDKCNYKIPNSTIPNTETLNPFIDSDEEIETHLIFEDEMIRSKNNSEKGFKTIQKFRLDSESLDYLRLKKINLFKDVLVAIKNNMIQESRKIMNDKEIEALKRFSQKDEEFSLMFRIILKKHVD